MLSVNSLVESTHYAGIKKFMLKSEREPDANLDRPDSVLSRLRIENVKTARRNLLEPNRLILTCGYFSYLKIILLHFPRGLF